jgi:hypothetical protein
MVAGHFRQLVFGRGAAVWIEGAKLRTALWAAPVVAMQSVVFVRSKVFFLSRADVLEFHQAGAAPRYISMTMLRGDGAEIATAINDAIATYRA